MNDDGSTIDTPRKANLKMPSGVIKVKTIEGIEFNVDAHKMAEAADRIGADKLDVLSIDCIRNAKGQLEPNYNTVRIAKRNEEK